MPATLPRFLCRLAVALLPFAAIAQQADTSGHIVLDAVIVNGVAYGIAYLPEHVCIGKIPLQWLAEKKRLDKLRNDIHVVYPYAVVAAGVFTEVNSNLDKIEGRRERKRYLRTVEKRLDACFKDPLKNLSIDQGHVLVRLINRQTGTSCFSIIRELKNGLSAVVWQSVGIVFGNNLARAYDPQGNDKDIEHIVSELEAANAYQYQLYQQQARLQARR